MVDFNPLKGTGSIAPAADTDGIKVAKITATSGELFFQDTVAGLHSLNSLAVGGGGVSQFTQLVDTPATYAGQALKSVRVNVGQSGLEFFTPSVGVSSFLALTDTPSDYIADAGKAAMVNSVESVLTFSPSHVEALDAGLSGITLSGSGQLTRLNSTQVTIAASLGGDYISTRFPAGNVHRTEVSWILTDLTLTNLAAPFSIIVINSVGVIEERTTYPDQIEKNIIILGMTVHDSGFLQSVVNKPSIHRRVGQAWDDEQRVDAVRRTDGNLVENGGGLTFGQSDLRIFGAGINAQSDITKASNVNLGGAGTLQFSTIKSSGEIFNSILTIVPSTYNNAGTETALTGSQAAVHQVLILSSGETLVQLGTTAYVDFNEASSSIGTESMNNGLYAEGRLFGVPIGVIVISAGASAWADGIAKIVSSPELINSSGVNSFTDLSDTPSGFANQFGKVLRVNSGQDQLEYADGGFMSSDDHSTGVFKGGAMSINGGNPSGFDISDGDGWTVDSHSGPISVTTPRSWTGLTNLTPDDILTKSSSFVALTFPGGVPTPVYQQTDFTLSQRRDLLALGRVVHTNMSSINGFIDVVCPTYDIMLQMADFLISFGPFNVSGNVYGTTGANLIPHKTVGASFKLGANHSVSRKSPNITSDPEDGAGLTGLTFGYLFLDPGAPDGFNISIPRTAYDPDIYDDGTGAIATVPNNQWTFQTLFFFPQANTHRFHLGQNTYGTKQDAIDAITAEPITFDPFLNTAVRRGWLIVKEGSTNLEIDTQGVFLEASDLAFGGGGGGGDSSTFIGHSDTPGTYGGQQGKVPTVTEIGPDRLDFVYPGVPADIAATKTTSNIAVGIVPIKLVYDVSTIAGDASLFSFASGTITVLKPIRLSIWAQYACVVGFGSINPVARIAIYVNGSEVKTNDTDGFSTTVKEPWLGIEHVISLVATDTVEVFAQTLSETIDIFATQNFMRAKVWRQE